MTNTAISFTEEQFINRVRFCLDMYCKEEELETPNVTIKVSSRMTTCLGCVEYEKNGILGTPTKIQFSKELMIGKYTLDFVDEIIQHEIIHCIVLLKESHKENHGAIFKHYCKKFNCSSDGGNVEASNYLVK